MNVDKIEKMKEVNKEQKEYYEEASGSEKSSVNSSITNMWRGVRKRFFGVFRDSGIKRSVDRIHKRWAGDVSDYKILDLGVGSGNPLTFHFARQSKEYIGIDLSESRIEKLRNEIDGRGISNAKVYACDFLGDEFDEKEFDLVYARAVLHHFKYLDNFLDVLYKSLNDGGRVLTFDPLQTWFPVYIIRSLYRPFQTDSAWEHPFTNDSINKISKYFDIEKVQGIYGRSKWATFLSIISEELARKKARDWHNYDLSNCNEINNVRKCLQIAMVLRK